MAPLTLTPEERATLEAWPRRRKTSQALALQTHIVLRCAEASPIKRPPLTSVSASA